MLIMTLQCTGDHIDQGRRAVRDADGGPGQCRHLRPHGHHGPGQQ